MNDSFNPKNSDKNMVPSTRIKKVANKQDIKLGIISLLRPISDK